MIKDINEIVFPVFSLPICKHTIYTEYNITYIKTPRTLKILDNKNIEGETLGIRRSKINSPELYKPKHVYFSLAQLIKAKGNKFIDSMGSIFTYKKTEYVPLKYFEVIDIKKIDYTYSYLKLKNIDYKVKIRTSPHIYGISYVGILFTKFGLIPFDYSPVKKENSRRKI